MMKKVSKTTVTWVIVSIALMAILGCVSPFYVPPSLPEPASEPIETIIVKTADAAFTQTAKAIPPTATLTYTPIPTKTITETPVPTATFIFSTWTPIPTVTVPGAPTGKDYSCSITSVSPTSHLAPRTDFDAKWVVKNTGTKGWDKDSFDYIYESGTKMHKKAAYDFPKNVGSGDSVTFTVDMISPKEPGSYQTFWILRKGKTKFCKMGITIVVK